MLLLRYLRGHGLIKWIRTRATFGFPYSPFVLQFLIANHFLRK